MNNKFNEILERIKTVSVITAIGSGVALYSLNYREAYLGWMSADWIPWVGIPMVIIFYLSLPFGAMGALKFITQEWTNFREMLKDLKDLKSRKKDG